MQQLHPSVMTNVFKLILERSQNFNSSILVEGKLYSLVLLHYRGYSHCKYINIDVTHK